MHKSPYNENALRHEGRFSDKKVETFIKILLQVALVFGLYWVGQRIEAVLPFAFPASVIMLLLLVRLLTGVVRVDHIREKSDFLLGNLGFFFIPVSVSIMNYVDLLWQHAAAFLTVCVVSMVLTYGATVWAVRLTQRLMDRGGKRK